MKLYRYRHDPTRNFTEAAWIEQALVNDYFIRLDDDTDGSFLMFLSNIWDDHLRTRNIYPVDEEPGTQKAVSADACPFCRRYKIPEESWTPYVLTNRLAFALCLHVEDIEAVSDIKPGDWITAVKSANFDAVEGTVRRVFAELGKVSVIDVVSKSEFIVRGSRIRTHTGPKVKDETTEAKPAKRKKAA
jgi:hypothetical protein